MQTAKQQLEMVFVGSESHPYAVNPTATIVGDALGLNSNYFAVDLEFACKAGTAGLQAAMGLLRTDWYRRALVIGTDCAQSKPHDVLEYTVAAAAAAFIVGVGAEVIAEVEAVTSVSSDTPDFWRRDGIKYPSHGGRFTGKPAYFKHIRQAAENLFSISGQRPADFDYCVFHMPNGKFPRRIAQQLGFTQQQLAPSLVVDKIGNPYSAATLVGLAAVLDQARPGERIFLVSYGSGAGADGFILQTTKQIKAFHQRQQETVRQQIQQKEYISYVQYLKQTGRI